MRWFQFRRFSSRLLLLIVGLVAVAQTVTYLLVARANRENAAVRIGENLELGARIFRRLVDDRVAEFVAGARLMSYDYAIRQLFLQETPDPATVRSALDTFRQRIGAPVMVILTPDGKVIADSRGEARTGELDFGELIKRAEAKEDAQEASGFAWLVPPGGLHVLAVVPLYAPRPVVAAWIGIAFPIDDALAASLKESTRLEATFVYTLVDEAGARPVASTLPREQAREVAQAAGIAAGQSIIRMRGESFVSTGRTLPLLSPGFALILLQRSLNVELLPSRQLEWRLQIIIPACLAVAAFLALGLAHGVSRPVRQLAALTHDVARGDYSHRVELSRADELGQLATAFNQMTAGLADRDRVRDLLGKVVSPEIAAQLLHSEAVLGGEEREVTILFSDLRNFTGLSEKLSPREVLDLLNRYLDRMSAIVEEHRGVVDKYIGDAIMALFGAPVSDASAADHALAAALAMDSSLRVLNAELAAEGRPQLAFGIGINTARVVAGNMGSRRRLNYTVIGDGVNVAARLGALTKEPAYATRIIVSESTLRGAHGGYQTRPLGEVTVRGRAEAVKIFALD
ncbi:MAG: hypothetical protein A3G75_09325 [Verrucomicrobia bacterium RIFCSPLOWO2_12_FULL_64_8]|nr:MAG: hypothetical protein A3G75_09325 [Verrucomicrobia bacterium RIFCSPLOWO2_12_FULL_64_8]